MLITDILRKNGEIYADKIALVERESDKKLRREMTWGEFDRFSHYSAF